MIRISKNADYAIVLLAHLASLVKQEAGEREVHNAREVAEATHVPLPTVSKLLKAMARADLLVSHRGIKGGFGLARPARTISVAEIICAVEGPIELIECAGEEHHCDQEPFCGVSANWQKINKVIFGALDNMPLTEMIRPPSDSLLQILPPPTPSGA